jgi:hypothetical protein
MQWTQIPDPDFESLAPIEAVGAMNVVVEIVN